MNARSVDVGRWMQSWIGCRAGSGGGVSSWSWGSTWMVECVTPFSCSSTCRVWSSTPCQSAPRRRRSWTEVTPGREARPCLGRGGALTPAPDDRGPAAGGRRAPRVAPPRLAGGSRRGRRTRRSTSHRAPGRGSTRRSTDCPDQPAVVPAGHVRQFEDHGHDRRRRSATGSSRTAAVRASTGRSPTRAYGVRPVRRSTVSRSSSAAPSSVCATTSPSGRTTAE